MSQMVWQAELEQRDQFAQLLAIQAVPLLLQVSTPSIFPAMHRVWPGVQIPPPGVTVQAVLAGPL